MLLSVQAIFYKRRDCQFYWNAVEPPSFTAHTEHNTTTLEHPNNYTPLSTCLHGAAPALPRNLKYSLAARRLKPDVDLGAHCTEAAVNPRSDPGLYQLHDYGYPWLKGSPITPIMMCRTHAVACKFASGPLTRRENKRSGVFGPASWVCGSRCRSRPTMGSLI